MCVAAFQCHLCQDEDAAFGASGNGASALAPFPTPRAEVSVTVPSSRKLFQQKSYSWQDGLARVCFATRIRMADAARGFMLHTLSVLQAVAAHPASSIPALRHNARKRRHSRWQLTDRHTGTSFTQKGRQSASGEGRKLPGICPGATTIVAPKSVGSSTPRATNGQMKSDTS